MSVKLTQLPLAILFVWVELAARAGGSMAPPNELSGFTDLSRLHYLCSPVCAPRIKVANIHSLW